MIVRELLDKLNIKEEDVIQIGENSYSRNELYSLPKNELIFDKDVSEIYINVYDGWQYDDTGKASVLETFNIFKDMFVKSAESKSPTRTSGMVCGISFDYIITNKKKRLVDNDW